MEQAKRFVASMGPADEEAKVLKKIAELNLGQSTSAFSKFGCKNAGFVEAMVLRGTTLHRGGFELKEVCLQSQRKTRETSSRWTVALAPSRMRSYCLDLCRGVGSKPFGGGRGFG